MSLKKKIVTLAAPVALLALAGCATGFPAQVQRFHAMPAPHGESFVIEPGEEELRGSLEFAQYADLVRRHLLAHGYSEALSRDQASMVVTMAYGVDGGRQQVVARPDPFMSMGWGFGYSPLWRPYYSRFGYFGHARHPFYWGWHDPFFWGPGYGYEMRSYTVYTSQLDLEIRRAADGQALFEGQARARSQTDALPALVPNLIEAMFAGFPGNSGETLRITVAPERTR